MNIVLGGGLVGVTTADSLLKDGHEVTLFERQPGVARVKPRQPSHRRDQPGSTLARGVPTKTFKTMTQADAPTMERRQLLW